MDLSVLRVLIGFWHRLIIAVHRQALHRGVHPHCHGPRTLLAHHGCWRSDACSSYVYVSVHTPLN